MLLIVALKRAILAFCQYRAFGKGKSGEKKPAVWAHVNVLGRSGGSNPLPPWKKSGTTRIPHIFLCEGTKKEQAGTWVSPKVGIAAVIYLWICIIPLALWARLHFCMHENIQIPLFLWNNYFFGKKQSQEWTRRRQQASHLGQCLPVGLGPVFSPMYVLQCVLRLAFKRQWCRWLIFCSAHHLLTL